ncbi:hypothetical protein DM02DRAFT_717996 [Periconia macrospinosa]|uniref:Zn(2)-C6 fungal-type domain-containing protein n=1 Tax=Periconia macrospinosa TaxID=97972 RepID=A0A2V1DT64_9PLEO|nr:hypothetical protein DM02DRAFT_717996 [Periconia macrospinosa]
MSAPLRPLLPAVPRAERVQLFVQPRDQQKRKKIPNACEPCRVQKSKCSGEQPTCSACTKRGTECRYFQSEARKARQKYDDLKQRRSDHEELLTLMRTLPEQDAANLFLRVRAGGDITTIVNHVKDGNLLLQLQLVPESRFRYELPYSKSMPEFLRVPGNTYLESLVYEAASLGSLRGQAQSSLGSSASSSISANSGTNEYQSAYLKPYHVAEPYEPLLGSVQPSNWTSISKDDNLMTMLLRAYFKHEYHCFAVLNKDYFLQDMANGATECCSSLLVNALLAYSCFCYDKFPNRSHYWDPSSLGYLFFAEAKRLWEIKITKGKYSDLPTIQAAWAINCVYVLCGLDKIGKVYRDQGVAMAHGLGLFSGNEHVAPQRLRDARNFTAWALFNFETLVSWEMFTAPSISSPPKTPLPNPLQDSKWYSEVWYKYPLNTSIFPMRFGSVFEATSRFRIILNDITKLRVEMGGKYTAAQAHGFGSRLMAWYADMPPMLSPKNIVLPAHFMLHIEYFTIVFALYQPFTSSKSWPYHPTPTQIVAEADRSIQTLLRLYYLRHGFETMDTYIMSPLAKIGFMALQIIAENNHPHDITETRSTLFLAAKGLRDQARNNYLALILYRVLKSQMGPEEGKILQKLVHDAGEEDKEEDQKLKDVQAQWMPSIVLFEEEQNERRLTRLVEKLEIGAENEVGVAVE